jgi:two-component system, OmpR family, response regulator
MRSEDKRGAGPIRLLIVDDEEDLVLTMAMRFRALPDFSVETAREGRSGLKLVGDFSPHVVLLDVSRPGLDGFEVCRRVLAGGRTPGPAVLLMTAGQSSDVAERAKAAGARDVVLKPFDEDVLIHLVRSAAGAAREAT